MLPVPSTPPPQYLAAFALAAALAVLSGCHLAATKHGLVRGIEPTLPLAPAQEPGGGAASSPPPIRKDPNDLPAWVVDPSGNGVVGAVGVASRRDRDAREQLEEARLSGRLELASMFEVRLQRVGRGEIEENGQTAGRAGDTSVRRNLVTIDRDLVDVVIAGSRQRALWFEPDSGDCYVWMVLDAKILDGAEQVTVEGISILRAGDPADPPRNPVVESRPPPVPDPSETPVPSEPTPPPQPTPETPKRIEESLRPLKTIPL